MPKLGRVRLVFLSGGALAVPSNESIA
jgi:hypothetical protein